MQINLHIKISLNMKKETQNKSYSKGRGEIMEEVGNLNDFSVLSIHPFLAPILVKLTEQSDI